MIGRRQFVLASLAAAAVPFMNATSAMALRIVRRQFPDVPLKSIRLRDGVWMIRERGGNSLLVATGAGPILVDTKISIAAQLLASEAKKLGGSLPTMVINTHHHYDHSGGNFVFDDSAQIVAHKNFNPRMQANLDDMFKPALATEINALRAGRREKEASEMAEWVDALTVNDVNADREYDTELDLDHGGRRLALRHFGNAHTDNDSIVLVGEANVIHMGDLFFHKCHPFIDTAAGADTANWRATVSKAIELCDAQTIVIPGHGDVSDRVGLKLQIDYLDRLQSIVEKAIAEGKSRETISKLEPPEFSELGFETLRPVALMAMYDELAKGMN